VARKLEITLDGVVVTARLLEEAAPETVKALFDVCPLEDVARHSRWSGSSFNVITRIERLQGLPVENSRHLLAPGTIVWIAPPESEFLVTYDDVRIYATAGKVLFGNLFAEIEGDLDKLRTAGHNLRLTGEKPISIRIV
jgi:hypothetical protein